MSHTSIPFPHTLESIAEQKSALLQQIHAQKDIMTNLTKDILAPIAPATNKAGAIMRAFNTGMAVFDGVRLGLKFMRKIRNYFGRRH
ncbi:hypothetical protein JN06_01717 [Bacteroides zoogleoformans]|uniref:Uncharacterized protein n=1 Tax=Bacteroides zoogleoformans TaxID=28119 RepID=A0ABN5IGC0_9BACE|nr:hypothetical protein [Bacteroides zoogleoformans]AVM51732.1 hypothetical protein C4H11_01065 [Bacteroides zoogleoformans]TWJ13841.1 hypothetical protein JN06_01717 [Bacteroides zoogleoformans]